MAEAHDEEGVGRLNLKAMDARLVSNTFGTSKQLDDDIEKLDKLQFINASARYELLSAN